MSQGISQRQWDLWLFKGSRSAEIANIPWQKAIFPFGNIGHSCKNYTKRHWFRRTWKLCGPPRSSVCHPGHGKGRAVTKLLWCLESNATVIVFKVGAAFKHSDYCHHKSIWLVPRDESHKYFEQRWPHHWASQSQNPLKKPHFYENHNVVMVTHGLIVLSIKQGMHSSLISCNLYNNPVT